MTLAHTLFNQKPLIDLQVNLGIAFPLNSPLSRAFSRAIIEIQEKSGTTASEKYGAVYKVNSTN